MKNPQNRGHQAGASFAAPCYSDSLARTGDSTVAEDDGIASPGVSVAPTIAPDAVDDWLIWQLADSALPTGGFAHSGGLEAAWQNGELRNRLEFVAFVEAALQQLGQAALPFVTASYGAPGRLAELDRLCDAFTSNHIANRASRRQGRALRTAVDRIFGRERVGAHAGSNGSVQSSDERTALQDTQNLPAGGCEHLAPVFGAVMKSLGISRPTTLRLFFFVHLRSLIAAAVRLNIVGSMEAQTLQYRLALRAGEVLIACESLTLDEIAQTAPLLEIWQGTHDRLYSRLFQS